MVRAQHIDLDSARSREEDCEEDCEEDEEEEVTSYDLGKVCEVSSNHRRLLDESQKCGCFHCLKIFYPGEVEEWSDTEKTALCPYCGVDAVLPDSAWFVLNKDLLEEMHEKCFAHNPSKKTRMEKKAERFVELGTAIGNLLEKKNKAYGDSFSESVRVLEILFPNGVPKSAYREMLTLVRMIDKMFRVATISQDENYDYTEGMEDAFRDLAGYSILALERVMRER